MNRTTRAKELRCVRCDAVKPRDEFVNDRTRVSGKFPWCKPCVLGSRRDTKLRDAEREKVPAKAGERTCPGCLCSLEGMHALRRFCSNSCKDRVRNWKVYGLEPDEFRALVAANEGRCPICQRNAKKWVIDHNHATGEVTGVTCSVCNQSLLAYSRHDLSTARRLLEYLESPPVRRTLGGRRVGPESLAQRERVAGWRKIKGYSIGLAQSGLDDDEDVAA